MARSIPITGITKQPAVPVYDGSKDQYFLDNSQYTVSSAKSFGVFTEVPSEDDTGVPVAVVSNKPKVPQLEDIEIVSNTTYKDDKNVTRGIIIFKVYNSSQEELLGIDVRVAQ